MSSASLKTNKSTKRTQTDTDRNHKPKFMFSVSTATRLFFKLIQKEKTSKFRIPLNISCQRLQLHHTCSYNRKRAALTSMRKSPVLSPACHATPPSSTDSRYCSAGKAGVGVNSSMGVSAARRGRTEETQSVTQSLKNCQRRTSRPSFDQKVTVRLNPPHRTVGSSSS